jgi:RNA polymerase sigma-70 factor (ECF subfamily)
MDINEKALLYRAQAGDRQAAGTLFEFYHKEIYTYIFYRVSNSSVAEDLSAEVFVRMVRRLPNYRDQNKPFISWLYTIAKHLIIDHYRLEEKRELVPIKDQLLEDDRPEPDLHLENREAVDCFRRAIRHLTEQQQNVIIHRFVEGRSVQDIADLINKSERAVRSLQHRALKSLEKALVREECL